MNNKINTKLNRFTKALRTAFLAELLFCGSTFAFPELPEKCLMDAIIAMDKIWAASQRGEVHPVYCHESDSNGDPKREVVQVEHDSEKRIYLEFPSRHIAIGGLKVINLGITYPKLTPVVFARLRATNNINKAKSANKSFEKEVKVLNLIRSLSKENQKAFAKVYLANSKVIVQELLDGDLSNLLAKSKGEISQELKFNLMLQASKAIRILHKLGYIHNDVKLENFLYRALPTQEIIVKLSDFGAARKLKEVDFNKMPSEFTLPYLDSSGGFFHHYTQSIEIMNQNKKMNLMKRDVYALGDILFQVINLDTPPWIRESQDLKVESKEALEEYLNVRDEAFEHWSRALDSSIEYSPIHLLIKNAMNHELTERISLDQFIKGLSYLKKKLEHPSKHNTTKAKGMIVTYKNRSGNELSKNLNIDPESYHEFKEEIEFLKTIGELHTLVKKDHYPEWHLFGHLW